MRRSPDVNPLANVLMTERRRAGRVLHELDVVEREMKQVRRG